MEARWHAVPGRGFRVRGATSTGVVSGKTRCALWHPVARLKYGIPAPSMRGPLLAPALHVAYQEEAPIHGQARKRGPGLGQVVP